MYRFNVGKWNRRYTATTSRRPQRREVEDLVRPQRPSSDRIAGPPMATRDATMRATILRRRGFEAEQNDIGGPRDVRPTAVAAEPSLKRALVLAQVWLFGRCYCASPYETLDLDDLFDVGLPTPWKSWAERSVDRRERRTGDHWHVAKWGRSAAPVAHRSLLGGRGGRQARDAERGTSRTELSRDWFDLSTDPPPAD